MKMLRIVSKRAGFRRCGVAHPDSPVDHPLDRFTKEQRKVLEAEPMLIVMEVEVKEAAPAKGGKSGGKSGGKATEAAPADPGSEPGDDKNT